MEKVSDDTDLVSVIISTFDRYDYCLEAVRSALNQTYANVQVIVVDDCSTDPRYLSMERAVQDKRFKYIRLTTSSRALLGFPSAGFVRNAGITESKGKYIAILDDDDIWLPTKLSV